MIFAHRDTSNKPGGRSIEFHKYLNRSYLFTGASQILDIGGFRTPHVKHIGAKKWSKPNMLCEIARVE